MLHCIRDWNIEAVCGYKPLTTFWMDFSIADVFGEKAIKDTYKRTFEEWNHDVKFVTELCMVLNWKIHQWYGKNDAYATLYDKLWRKVDTWCMRHLKGNDLSYFLDTTD